jgi:hypothetical protein
MISLGMLGTPHQKVDTEITASAQVLVTFNVPTLCPDGDALSRQASAALHGKANLALSLAGCALETRIGWRIIRLPSDFSIKRHCSRFSYRISSNGPNFFSLLAAKHQQLPTAVAEFH